MKVSEGTLGRVFIIRLEDGDMMPDAIEKFAAEKGIEVGYVTMIGDLGEGEIIGGPVDTKTRPIRPRQQTFSGPYEGTLLGLLCPGQDGSPDLHLHGTIGRQGETEAGCFRLGFEMWLMGEVILYEILGTTARRIMEPDCGFPLLEPTGESDGTPALKKSRPAFSPPEPALPPEPVQVLTASAITGPILCLLNAEAN